MKKISTKKIRDIQKIVRSKRWAWKEGCDYDLLDKVGFTSDEAIGYWSKGESFIFKTGFLWWTRYWCIHKSYFKK